MLASALFALVTVASPATTPVASLVFSPAGASATIAVPAPVPAPGCEPRHAPGAIIVATTGLYPYAFRLADRLADAGVIILLPHNGDATVADLELDMRMALDSLKRRADVCASRVGVIVLSGSPRLMPALLKDTSLAFVVSMRVPPDTVDNVNYTVARTPTLVLRARTLANDTASSVELRAGSTDNRNIVLTAHVGESVTIWPLAHAQLDRFTELLEPLADRVVQWIQRRVDTPELRPGDPIQLQTIHTAVNTTADP